MNLPDRYIGCLLGLAAGDALGTTLEFRKPRSFEPISDMTGGGPFNLAPGEWTDDTSMALCLAESLIKKQDFDPVDQMERYTKWQREGHLSSTGRCFDIGFTVANALTKFEWSHEPFAGATDEYSAGNGSLMRLAPVPMAFAHLPNEAIHLSGEMSRTTHGATEAIDGCRYYASLITGALSGVAKDELSSPNFCLVDGVWDEYPLAPKIAAIANGSFKTKQPPDIKGTGYVVDAMEAALWAFFHSDDFEEGALLAVNLGDDADTTGAIYGQLAGAHYGAHAIPAGWREKIVKKELIEAYAISLLDFASKQPTQP